MSSPKYITMGNICTRIYYRLQPKRERQLLLPKYKVPPPTPYQNHSRVGIPKATRYNL